jgi:hypothetical protein
VLAALPVITSTATAATVGATVVKGGAGANAVVSVGMLGAIIGPIMGIIGGWFGVKSSLDQAQSQRERRFIIRWTIGLIGLIVISLGVTTFFVTFGVSIWKGHPVLVSSCLMAFWLVYGGLLLGLVLGFRRQHLRIRREEAARSPVGQVSSSPAYPRYEYRSRWTLLGLPLLHIRMGRAPEERLVPAKGWIAMGDVSFGVVLSMGGIAVGGIAMGGVSAGLVGFGGIVFGMLAMGGLAIGPLALGGAALGYLAMGGYAMAWHAAQGGLAMAHNLAEGGMAYAQHANDEVASAFMSESPFFTYAIYLMRHSVWVFLLCWCPLLLVMWRSKTKRANG